MESAAAVVAAAAAAVAVFPDALFCWMAQTRRGPALSLALQPRALSEAARSAA